MPAPRFSDQLDKIIAYESGELTQDEAIELFRELIDSGLVWQLQGHYGRVASALIESGTVIPKRAIN